MYSDDDLDAAVADNVLTPDAAAAFRAFVARRQTAYDADEENVRLLTSFNDIFVTIAAVLLLSALGWLAAKMVPALGGACVAAAAWAFGEYFTRRRRMALPSMVLLLAFVGGVFAAGLGLVGAGDVTRGGYGVAASAAVAAVAAWVHWKRFMVPITVAAGAAAVVMTVVALGLALVPSLRAFTLPLVFLAGLGLFALALKWDASDLARKTRRSDVAFWLHLAAAPLIVHPVFALLDGKGTAGGAALAVAVYALLALVALAVDRRALLVSALAYVLYAATALFEAAGSSAEAFALTALVIGSALLSLSAFWHHARRLVLAPLPDALRSRLPQA